MKVMYIMNSALPTCIRATMVWVGSFIVDFHVLNISQPVLFSHVKHFSFRINEERKEYSSVCIII
jgi:hypothetical protein